MKHPQYIDFLHPPPMPWLRLPRPLQAPADTGTAQQQVKRSQVSFRLRYGSFERDGIGNIGNRCESTSPTAFDLVPDSADFLLCAGADAYCSTGLGQGESCGSSDSATRRQ